MRKLMQIVGDHGFVVLLSIAAIVHSAHTINSVFNGTEPTPMYAQHWWGWYLPGLAFAVTIDVGMLTFVVRMQRGERGFASILGYIILCAFMALGQFIFVATHTTNFTLAAGVASYYKDAAEAVIKSSLWLYPAALPIVSAIYAFSVKSSATQGAIVVAVAPPDAPRITAPMQINRPEPAPKPLPPADRPLPTVIPLQADSKVQKLHTATCACGWSKDGYASERAAQNALTAHRRRCKVAA